MSDQMAEIRSIIRESIGRSVPFAAHTGVRLAALDDGLATAELPEEPFTLNHIGTQHAGALFTLAETASGAAMAGALASVIAESRPVVRTSSISFERPARGAITAKATTAEDPADLRSRYEEAGRVEFDVDVELVDTDGQPVARLTATWVVVPAK